MEITVEEAYKILAADPAAILLDVRSHQEYNEGHLVGSINISVYHLNRCVEKILPNKNATIVVYCQGNSRSYDAIDILKRKGYLGLYHIYGGLDGM